MLANPCSTYVVFIVVWRISRTLEDWSDGLFPYQLSSIVWQLVLVFHYAKYSHDPKRNAKLRTDSHLILHEFYRQIVHPGH